MSGHLIVMIIVHRADDDDDCVDDTGLLVGVDVGEDIDPGVNSTEV